VSDSIFYRSDPIGDNLCCFFSIEG